MVGDRDRLGNGLLCGGLVVLGWATTLGLKWFNAVWRIAPGAAGTYAAAGHAVGAPLVVLALMLGLGVGPAVSTSAMRWYAAACGGAAVVVGGGGLWVLFRASPVMAARLANDDRQAFGDAPVDSLLNQSGANRALPVATAAETGGWTRKEILREIPGAVLAAVLVGWGTVGSGAILDLVSGGLAATYLLFSGAVGLAIGGVAGSVLVPFAGASAATLVMMCGAVAVATGPPVLAYYALSAPQSGSVPVAVAIIFGRLLVVR